ncbi:MAG: IS110 family transposase [Candidatus Polarisedimenticolia bacterium]
MEHTTIAVDLAKSVFEVAVSDQPGRLEERHRLSRAAFLRFFVDRPAATVVLEACGSAHHWGRELQALGHQVVLLPPHTVRPYVPRNKTDRADAKGILEAFRNQDLHPVPVKSVAQQTLTALHRLRSTWIADRTARLNTVRGLLREFGFTIPVGARHVLPHTWPLLNDADSGLPEALRPALVEACAEIHHFEERIDAVERQLMSLANQTPVVTRLLTIPGVGLITATAMVALVGDVQRFPSGRHFASYLGLTPRERSSGLIRRLGAISKRGDLYLRMLLTHGARSILWTAKSRKRTDPPSAWALEVQRRRGHNKAAIALANKLARIVWAVWKHDVDYTRKEVPAA